MRELEDGEKNCLDISDLIAQSDYHFLVVTL